MSVNNIKFDVTDEEIKQVKTELIEKVKEEIDEEIDEDIKYEILEAVEEVLDELISKNMVRKDYETYHYKITAYQIRSQDLIRIDVRKKK